MLKPLFVVITASAYLQITLQAIQKNEFLLSAKLSNGSLVISDANLDATARFSACLTKEGQIRVIDKNTGIVYSNKDIELIVALPGGDTVSGFVESHQSLREELHVQLPNFIRKHNGCLSQCMTQAAP